MRLKAFRINKIMKTSWWAFELLCVLLDELDVELTKLKSSHMKIKAL